MPQSWVGMELSSFLFSFLPSNNLINFTDKKTLWTNNEEIRYRVRENRDRSAKTYEEKEREKKTQIMISSKDIGNTYIELLV